MAITFDGPNRLIVLTSGTVGVGVRELWSRWADWVATSDNSKYLPAFRSVGGDETDPGEYIPIFVFMLNDWRIRPQEADHTLVVDDGVLRVQGGGDPFVDTLGAFTVRVVYKQPVQAITVATGGSSGPSAASIAAAVVAALQATTIPVDVQTMNGAEVIGDGTLGNGWRGVGVSP